MRLTNNLRRDFAYQRRSLTVTLLSLLMLLVGCREDDWTPERIERALGVPIPADAVEVSYRGGYIYGGRLELSFRAPPESVSEFVEGICNGILIQGYDPFNSIDTADPVPRSILIKVPHYPHYSRSPDTLITTAGNRCVGRSSTEFQIAVDRRDANLYTVRFEIPCACTDFSDRHGYATYINPLRGTGFPLMVIGMMSVDDEFVLAHDVVCMETQTGYYYQREWFPEAYYGADVQILVDDDPLTPAYIPEDRWELTPRHDADGNFVQPSLWNYCFIPDWPSGLQTMTLNVTTTDGIEHTFSWQFRVN